MDGWEDGGGDGAVLPLSCLFGGAPGWKWGSGVGATGETLLVFSAEWPPLISKLKALPLYMSFALSSNTLASLRLCLVCLSVARVSLYPAVLTPSPVSGMPGKVMATKLAWLSLSLACHSALPPSCVPDGEKGQGRPTEAAKVEVLLALCRSPFLCRSLRVTGAREEPGSTIRTEGRVRSTATKQR